MVKVMDNRRRTTMILSYVTEVRDSFLYVA